MRGQEQCDARENDGASTAAGLWPADQLGPIIASGINASIGSARPAVSGGVSERVLVVAAGPDDATHEIAERLDLDEARGTCKAVIGSLSRQALASCLEFRRNLPRRLERFKDGLGLRPELSGTLALRIGGQGQRWADSAMVTLPGPAQRTSLRPPAGRHELFRVRRSSQEVHQ
ncbi:hypothetical protein GCM10023349_14890 [Nocardioides conyzicola]|uniref:Uncharacterized protein n=1 Tax=Nocardioides conyzicola TaxID=1651781 RepID=A0ABP8X4H5_9ACTN